MEAFEPKPTYEEQLAWLDMVQLIYSEDPEMIKAIKENVIAVRNYERAIEKELQPVQKEIEEAFEDLVAFGEARQPMVVEIQTFNPHSAELNQALDNIHANWMKLKTYAEGEQNVQSYKESMGLNKPFVFRADKLNPREELAIDNRIKQLQGELSFELSRKKQFRSQQVIDHCHNSINNLKKWKSQSL